MGSVLHIPYKRRLATLSDEEPIRSVDQMVNEAVDHLAEEWNMSKEEVRAAFTSLGENGVDDLISVGRKFLGQRIRKGKVIEVEHRRGKVHAMLKNRAVVEIHVGGIIGSSTDYPEEGDIISLTIKNGIPTAGRVVGEKLPVED